jgi:pimeloyl-ACP methyl ester carboxylesterase
MIAYVSRVTFARSDGAAQKRNTIMDMPDSASVASPTAPRPNLTVTLPDGRLLGYAEYGDPSGAPIFGFHGTPGSRLMFSLAHPVALNLGIRLIAPERPGFGISTYQRGRTLASYAIDIADFADALAIGQFAVAGVSGGGPYAAACAALLPDRVSALGLVSPVGPMAGAEKPPSIGKGHYFAFRITPRMPPLLAAIFAFGRYAFLYAPNAIYGFLLHRASRSDWKILSRGEVRRNLLQGVAEGCRPGIGAGMQEMRIFSRPWNVPLQGITAPAFLWQGMADRNVSIAAALCLAELVPHCRTRRIENAGHYWIFDNMAEVLQTLAGAAGGGAASTGSSSAQFTA